MSGLSAEKNVSLIHQNKKFIHKCKSLFKSTANIKIVENLSPANRSVFNECQKLKREGLIEKFWTRNGFVRFKFSDNEERPVQINHSDELFDLFPDFYKDYY